jgi:hypothetical protein
MVIGYVGKGLRDEGQRRVSVGSEVVGIRADQDERETHLRITTARMRSRKSSATLATPAGSVALKTAFWILS